MYLTTLDFAVIGVYFSGLLALGLGFSKWQTSENSYFLGNRRLPWFVVGLSMMATIISTLTYLSLPGELIKHGVGYFFVVFGILASVPFITRVIIPALMRLPVTSVYEYFERRYGLSLRTLGAVVFIFMRLTWMGLVIYTTAFAVSRMTGWDAWSVILVIGLITTFYTTVGGMPAVVWTDFAQGLLLLGGAVFIPFYVAFRTQSGLGDWWNAFSQAGRTEVPIFSLDLTVRLSVIGIMINDFLWNVCTHGADQIAAQRYLSTSSAKAAKRSVWVFAVAVVFLFILLALGVNSLMQATQWNLVEMIFRLNHLFLAPLGALFLAGIFLRRVGVAAAWLGFVAGVAASFLISFSKEIFHMEEGISFMWILAGSLAASLSVSYLSGFLFKPPSKEQLDSLTLTSKRRSPRSIS